MASGLVGEVGWDSDPAAQARVALAALAEDVAADLCVIGLGGSGLAAVAEGLRRGLRVVGIDAGRVGQGAAGRNGGFLLAGPADAVHLAAETYGVEPALALYRDTLAELDALSAELGPDVIRRQGSIRLAGLPGDPRDDAEQRDRAAELADCEKQLAFMREHELTAEAYAGPLGRGLYFPDDGAMNPVLRVFGLASLHGAPGAARLFERTPALGFEPGRVVTPHGSVRAPLVVVAVDGRLEGLLPELAGCVRTARLQMLATAPLEDPALLPCPVYGRWGYDYAQQDASGRMFVGGGRDLFVEDEWTPSDEPTAPVQDYLDRLAERFAGGASVRVTHRWAASVGFTPDGRPLVAQVRPGVVVCGGYNGTGNLVGPIAARAALALGLDGTTPPACFDSDGTL